MNLYLRVREVYRINNLPEYLLSLSLQVAQSKLKTKN